MNGDLKVNRTFDGLINNPKRLIFLTLLWAGMILGKDYRTDGNFTIKSSGNQSVNVNIQELRSILESESGSTIAEYNQLISNLFRLLGSNCEGDLEKNSYLIFFNKKDDINGEVSTELGITIYIGTDDRIKFNYILSPYSDLTLEDLMKWLDNRAYDLSAMILEIPAKPQPNGTNLEC